MSMLRSIMRNAGIRPRALLTTIKGWARYSRERRKFRAMEGADALAWGAELPMIGEWDEPAGSIGAYFIQDQTVARWIYEESPGRHVDVGSRIDGFVGSLSVFRSVEVIDLRAEPPCLRNIIFHQMDLMQPLAGNWVSCTDSLSCLHTIEHFGLGRYGDRLDPDGHLKGLEQLKRMVAPGGVFYLSTPIGPERVEFNAHRVFNATTLLGWFRLGWQIERFAIIDDANCLHVDLDWKSPEAARSFGCRTGLGIVAARKLG